MIERDGQNGGWEEPNDKKNSIPGNMCDEEVQNMASSATKKGGGRVLTLRVQSTLLFELI